MINDRIMPATNSTASTAPDATPPPPAPAAVLECAAGLLANPVDVGP